jgi:hypothetical protein
MNQFKERMFSSIKNKLDYQRHNSNNSNFSFDSFKDHWKQVLLIFNKNLVDDTDILQVKSNLEQMINILLNELNNLVNISLKLPNDGNEDANQVLNAYHGPIWEYLFKNNIFEVIFLWSLSYPEYLYDLKYEQLKYYENLLNHLHLNDQTNMLLFKQLHRPLFSLLNHCSSHNSQIIETKMIQILNQLCVDMCKNSNLLNIFFEHQQQQQQQQQKKLEKSGKKEAINHSTPTIVNARTKATSKFFIFSLLIPYIHKEGSLGW